MSFEHYIRAGDKTLRCGFTTGACAALAASGAAGYLVTGRWPETVSLRTPKGWMVEVPLENCRREGDRAVCAVRKDGGDDVDQTNGTLIEASVVLTSETEIRIDGGPGVGRVTKPGLDQPVGAAAINRVPREMIARAVEDVLSAEGVTGGAWVVISVPQGVEIAQKTFNPHLGIEGGISILGTSGIVEPMSTRAIVDTIAIELRQAAAQGHAGVILTPGNYGMDFLKQEGLDHLGVPVVKCANFIGDALDEAVLQGFTEILLVGHIGKLVKLAGGIFNTHSRTADCRGEIFTAYAAVCGGGAALCQKLLTLPTADACLTALTEAGLRDEVIKRLLHGVQARLSRRVGQSCCAGAVLFSNEFGLLGRTTEAKEMLQKWNGNEKAPFTPSALAPVTRPC